MQFIVWARIQDMERPKMLLITDVIPVHQKMVEDREIPYETQEIIFEFIGSGKFKAGYTDVGDLTRDLLGPVLTKEGLIDESERSADLEDFLDRLNQECKERIQNWSMIDDYDPRKTQVLGYLAPVSELNLQNSPNVVTRGRGIEGKGIFLKRS
jgi:hypothetical protein